MRQPCALAKACLAPPECGSVRKWCATPACFADVGVAQNLKWHSKVVNSAGASHAHAADEGAITDGMSFVNLRALRHAQQRQWWIALREMLRKRALIAGKARILISSALAARPRNA